VVSPLLGDAMRSQEYLDFCTMMGEVTLTLLDWSDEAQEDLLLIALNGVAPPPTLETYLGLLAAMRMAVEPK
jgi:hypothetical protein